MASSSTPGDVHDITKRKIFLCTFTPSPFVYSICPFAIKLESFFRINGIKYELKFVDRPGPKGMIPWIILDDEETGEEMPDSNVIISKIQQELSNADKKEQQSQYSESLLTPCQRAATHMLIRMLEEHLAQIGFYYRYGLHMEEFVRVLDIANRYPAGSIDIFRAQPDVTKTKTNCRGLTRHSDEELWGFANDDILMISDMLGDQKYFFGNSKPTLADCAVFGHLSQFLWIPMEFPQKKFIHEKCPNLLTFMDRFRDEYWTDWDDLCETLVNWPKSKDLHSDTKPLEKKDSLIMAPLRRSSLPESSFYSSLCETEPE